jgi:PAS domain S-box-containing protein
MKSNPPEIEIGMLAGNLGPDSGHQEDFFSNEKARGESDDSLKTIFNNVNAVIVRLNKYGKIIEANAKIEDCFGYKPEEVIGKHFTKLGILTIKDLPKIVKLFGDAIRGKQLTYHDELEARDKAGNKKYIDVNCTVVKKEGKIDSAVSIIYDVTERRKAEETLHMSEETFSKVFHASPNPICIISIEAETFIDINESYTRFTGYTRIETLGRTAKELGLWVNEDDLIAMRSILMKKGRVYNLQFATRMKSGEIRNGLFSAEIVNISGRMCIILVITDITEQKWAEDALKESEEFTSSLLMNTPNPIFVVYPDTAIKYVNPAFEKLTGFTLAEIIGMKTPYPWWPQETKDEINTKLKESALGNGIKKEMAYQKKSGERFWVELNVTLINKNGERQYILINWTDITERKQMEEAMRFSDAAFKSIHESIIAVDNDRIITYWNNISEQLFGIPASEAIGMKLKDVVKPVEQYPGQDLERIRQLSAQGYNRNELLYATPRGEVWVDTTIQVMKEGDKQYGYVLTALDITGRKQAEKAIQDSEEKFSKAFSSASDAMAIFSSKGGKFLEVNDSYVKLSGYSCEELVGRNADELNMWGKPEDRENILHKTVEKGRVVQEEFVFRTKGGEMRTCLFSAETINISGERRMIVVVQDITERKQMETSLRESEEKFFKAFNASANAICITSLTDKRFIEANDSFSRFTGYPHDEVIGSNTASLNLWAKDEDLRQFIAMLQKDGRVYNREFSSRTKSGEVRIGLASIELLSIGGEPCRMVVITDITERKKTEESLRLLGSVTQQVTDSIIVTDPEFKITYMNKAAQVLFGYSIDEALGTDIGLLDSVPIPKIIQKNMLETLASGKTWTTVLPKRRKDGSTFLCDCRRSPLFDEEGRLISYIILHHDITEQKETDTKLKTQKKMVESILSSMPEGVLVTDSSDRIMLANESFRRIFHTGRRVIENKLLNEVLSVGQLFDLYTSIKTRNTDDHSLEFRHKIKETEKIIACVIIKMDSERMLLIFSDVSREREEEDKLYLMDRLASLGEMAAGLAHELNNPLTGILTLSQLLVNSDLPDEHKEDLQCIYSEAKRAANIVKNVLLFTRNNSYENGRSSVNEVVKEVLRLREHEEKMKNINVVTNFQDNLPEIQLDKYQLQQVFLNIILNAEAAIETAKRPGTLTVTTERVNNHVNIMFSDSGCGIKKQVLPRIFDPFFTTKEIGKGTGLGLSICYGIIVKHDGKISVKTQVGKGTTFTIRMPIASQ